jgi:hypothetical protein
MRASEWAALCDQMGWKALDQMDQFNLGEDTMADEQMELDYEDDCYVTDSETAAEHEGLVIEHLTEDILEFLSFADMEDLIKLIAEII